MNMNECWNEYTGPASPHSEPTYVVQEAAERRCDACATRHVLFTEIKLTTPGLSVITLLSSSFWPTTRANNTDLSHRLYSCLLRWEISTVAKKRNYRLQARVPHGN